MDKLRLLTSAFILILDACVRMSIILVQVACLGEWWYNINFQSSIHTTPYEVVYGQVPPIHLPYLPEKASSLAVELPEMQ